MCALLILDGRGMRMSLPFLFSYRVQPVWVFVCVLALTAHKIQYCTFSKFQFEHISVSFVMTDNFSIQDVDIVLLDVSSAQEKLLY